MSHRDLFLVPKPLSPTEKEERRRAFERSRTTQRRAFLHACGVQVDELQHLDREPLVLEPNTARTAVADFMPSKLLVLVLFGLRGAGKSLAAAEAFLFQRRWAEEVWGNDWTWAWSLESPTVFLLAAEIAAFGNYGVGRDRFEALFDPPLLVVDDLGTERSFERSFDELLTQRIRRHNKTIVTSNLPYRAPVDKPEAVGFAERYGDRVVSRIQGHGVVKLCREPDYRARTKNGVK